MKKGIIAIITIILLVLSLFMFTAVFAAENNETTDRAIDEETESQLVELKEDVANAVED